MKVVSASRQGMHGTRVASRGRQLAALLAAASVVSAAPALAAISTYTGPGGTTTVPKTGAFNDANNWSPAGVPASDPTLELDFNNSGANSYIATNDLVSVSLNKVVLNSASTGATTIDGNALNFVINGATLPTITQSGGGAVTISTPITMANNLTVNGNGGGVLTINGPISGSATFTKSGSSTLTLSGNNAYTGLTTVNQGTLNLQSAAGSLAVPGDLTLTPVIAANGAVLVKLLASNQIAPTSNVTIATGSGLANGNNQLDLNNFDNTIASLTFVPVTSGQVMQVTTGTGTLTLNGPIAVNGNNSNPISITGNLNLGGAARTISGSNTNASKPVLTIGAVVTNGGFTQTYAGTVALTGNNTFTSDVTLNAGAMNLSGNNGGTGNFNVNGGTLTLSGANTFTGAINVPGGTVSFNSIGNAGETSSALGAPTAAARTITVGGTGGTNGTLTYTGPATSTDRPIAIDAAAGGASTLNQNGTGVLTWTGALSGPHSFILAGTGTGVFSGPITLTGAVALNKNGAGTWTLSNTNNTYPSLAINVGTLSVPTVNAAGAAGPLGNGTGAITVSTSSNAGTFQYTGVSASTNRPFALNGGTNNTSTFDVTTGTTLLTLSSAVSGAGSMTKVGAGALTLTGNTYTGSTTVNAGTLTVTLPNLGDASTVSIANGAALNLAYSSSSVNDTINTLILNGVVQQPGTYNAGNASPFITGTGNLVVTAPEPATMGMAGIAVIGLLARRRRRA